MQSNSEGQEPSFDDLLNAVDAELRESGKSLDPGGPLDPNLLNYIDQLSAGTTLQSHSNNQGHFPHSGPLDAQMLDTQNEHADLETAMPGLEIATPAAHHIKSDPEGTHDNGADQELNPLQQNLERARHNRYTVQIPTPEAGFMNCMGFKLGYLSILFFAVQES